MFSRTRTRLLAVLGAAAVLAVGAWLFVRQALPTDIVRAQVERQLSVRIGQPVHVGSASASLFPVAIDLADLTIGNPAAVRLGRVRVVTGLRALFSRQIADAEIVVEDGRVPWPLPFTLNGPATATPGDSRSVTIVSIRTIRFRQVTFVTALPPVTIDLDAALAGNRLDVSRLLAQSDRNHLEASGVVPDIARLEGQFHAKGDLTFAGYAAHNVAATVAVVPRGLTLSPFSFDMFDGSSDGRLDVDLAGETAHVELRAGVNRIDLAEVMKNTGSPDGITGRLAGTMALAARGNDGASLLHTARGTIQAKVVDGTLPYLDLVRPVIVAFGKPSAAAPTGSGSEFSILSGTFALANGTLTTDNLALESRDFSARGRATLHAVTAALDARIDILLSPELTAQAGTDLRRYAGQNGRVVVPATVSGTLNRPSVFVDPGALFGRAVGNELKRRAGSLLDGLFKKKKGGGGG